MHFYHDLAEKVYKTIVRESMIKQGDLVLVAFSGGPDSLALLHILNSMRRKLDIDLAAAHLNHGLRGAESKAEADWVEQLCAAWQIPCYLGYWDGLRDKPAGLSPEEAARQARLNFLQTQQKEIGAAVIAQGHHGDDQAETMIIRLLNGAGLKGLGGIKPVRLPFIRPLIHCSRQEIMDYCQDFDLNPRQDSSNYSDAFLRNKIRHQLIPLLKTYNPRLTETLGRTAEILQAEEEFLNAMAIKALADVQEVNNNLSGAEKPCLKLKEFLALEPVLARRVVRLWIGLELDYGSVLRVMDLAHKGKVGNVAELVGPWIVKRGYKEIYVLPKEEPQVLSQSLPGQPDPKQPDCKQPAPETRPMPEDAWVEVGGELLAMARICSWAEGKTISEEISLSEGVLRYVIPWQRSLGLPIWRSRKSGDWIQFAYGRKKLSRWLIDQKIPAPKRDLLYCLAWQQQILWVPDLLKGQGPIRKSQAEEYLWVWCKKQNKKNM